MAETNITRCPHCQTTFRIRTEQLAAAKGAVRCGSCLQVFTASDNLVVTASEQNPKPVTKQPPTDDIPVQIADDPVQDFDTQPTHDGMSFDDIPDQIADDPLEDFGIHPIEPTEADNDHVSTVDLSSQSLSALDLSSDIISSDDQLTDDLLNEFGIDSDDDELHFDDIPDQIADDPLEDFGLQQPDSDIDDNFSSSVQLDDSIFSMPEGSSAAEQGSQFEFNDEFDSKSSISYQDESWAAGLIEDEEATSKSSSDESWAEALLDVDDDLLDDIDAGTFHATKDKEEHKDDFVQSLDDDNNDSNHYHLGGNDDIEQEEVELSILDSLSGLHDEPLALGKKFAGKKNNKKAQKHHQYATSSSFSWLWLSASILMLLVMMAQVSYFKFDTWSRHPDYRPAYSSVCQLIGCSLPAIQDIQQMSTQHFMVRPHPEVKNALSIDTLLINNADYQQPFPDLQLIFTGLEDQVIASRSFKPQEYLAGELAGTTIMPAKVPVHIAFEIINPGSEAVSYRIKLSPNH